jgi:chaperonin GroES
MSIEKLLKLVESPNIAEQLDEDQLHSILEDASTGFDIDEESCQNWIDMNKEALKMIKAEADNAQTKNYAHSKVIYPLLASSTIQLSSRLIPHLVRNNRVVECAVLGPDPDGTKAAKAKSVGDFFSYELLVDSDSWLLESHKLIQMLCAWGTAYRKLSYDDNQDKVLSEVISPEDVIINANTTCIEKARRITVRNYMTKNQIIEHIRADKFLDIDLDELTASMSEKDEVGDVNPVYEILEQFCYIDLDEDGYEEPYVVFFNQDSQKVLGIYAGYELSDIHVNVKGNIKKIVPRPYIIDYHCIDDPAGKYHSMGLNHLLFHQNKSITSVLRQLIDSGTLANQQGGFVTKAFKTKKRDVVQELGKFTQLEIPPSTDIRSQIMPLPFKEPSQVLFSLLGLLIEAGKETGFVTQALMGDSQGQNVPATTMLAIIEQGTRAFKPMVQKLYHSLKKEFKMMFHLYGKYSTQDRFIRYSDTNIQISQQIFNEDELDIIPVADPTQSSEAHRFIKLQALQQLMQTPLMNVLNPQAMAMRIFKDLQIDKPEELIAPPQPPQPDPKMEELKMKQQVAMSKLDLEKQKGEREQVLIQIETMKTQIKQMEAQIRANESDERQRMMIAKSQKDQQEANVKERMANVAEDKVEVERERLELMAKQQRNEARSQDSASGT